MAMASHKLGYGRRILANTLILYMLYAILYVKDGDRLTVEIETWFQDFKYASMWLGLQIC